MRHIVYAAAQDNYPTAILVKGAAFLPQEIDKAYVKPLEDKGVNRQDLIIVAAEYQANNKAPAKFIKEQLDPMLAGLDAVGTKRILCCDANYFKVLTKQRKAEPHLGYKLQCAIEGYEHMEVALGINHKALIHNPNYEPKLALALETFATMVNGTYQGLGTDIITSAEYPENLADIEAFLERLHQYPILAADTEAFSLRFNEAGIGTIGFAWSASEGGAFCCDYKGRKAPTRDGNWGERRDNLETRALIKNFLETYEGTLIWHNGPYDLKLLIWNLYMDHPLDYAGMLRGLEVVTRNWHDTKVIAYLALNSTAGNELSLKDLAHSFAGNWAEDVTDIRKIKRNALLRYNLVDCLSTFWVFEKHYPRMVEDQQEAIYTNLMMPSQKTIIQMELVGMPMIPDQIQAARDALQDIIDTQTNVFEQSPTITKFNSRLQQEECDKANAKLKTKQHPVSKFANVKFNPASNPQLQKLLYEEMGLPVIDKTKTKAPATGADTLDKLINHATDQGHKDIIEALIARGKAAKVLSAFIPAFEAGLDKGDGVLWLHGSFNLGGTVSGRLSSSEPNLQNIPSGSEYGKLVKNIFAAPKGFIFCGADFASLEDRINALITKDPNKLKVYTDGYDGHCLRTFYYWPHMFPDIQVDDVAAVNLIKDTNDPQRSLSKAPTFALTYQGTWVTLMKNCGFTEEEAKAIETNYHELYKVSTAWVKAEIDKAARQGYAEAAFGLRIRTPLLQKTFLGKSSTPKEAEAEARTLGNAISGQSYGLLTNRAANAVMERVWASEYRYDILIVAMIHDAIYFIVKDDVAVVEWLNRVLIEEMEWQELPEIAHDDVKLGANLGLFYPNWANEIELPNNASRKQILEVCAEAMSKLEDKEAA